MSYTFYGKDAFISTLHIMLLLPLHRVLLKHALHPFPVSTVRLGVRASYEGQNLILVDQLDPLLRVPSLERGAHGVEDAPHLFVAALLVRVGVRTEGASINDIRKNFVYFLPPPPCPHLELIYGIKFTQPTLPCPFFHDPLPPLMQTSYLEAP